MPIDHKIVGAFGLLYALSSSTLVAATVDMRNPHLGRRAVGSEAKSLAERCAEQAPVDYDLELHIVALFVLLVASTAGVVIPVLFGTLKSTFWKRVLAFTKYFGTGVIISTGYVHLMSESLQTFANPCIGELPFRPTGPAIIMASSYGVFLIDFFGARLVRRTIRSRSISFIDPTTPPTLEESKPIPSPACAHGLQPKVVGGEESSKQAYFDVCLLESGIVFHSVMVGVTLGASAGDGWLALFIATCFHQFVEGLGLGSRIGVLSLSKLKLTSMCTAFALITSIGIGIGIGVHATWNENDRTSLLVIGTLDCISAGILLYAGLIQLLAHDFIYGEMRDAPTGKVVMALSAVALGSAIMSLIGKWA